MRSMISIPGSLFFANSVMMSSAPAKSARDARYVSQDPFILGNQCCPIQSRLQSLLRVRLFYVERYTKILRIGKSGEGGGGYNSQEIKQTFHISRINQWTFNRLHLLFFTFLLLHTPYKILQKGEVK